MEVASLGVRHIQREAGRRQNRKGVPLNVMIVGRAGLGKSTLLRTLVGRDFFPNTAPQDNSDPTATKTVEVNACTHELDDLCGNRLLLTLIDTPGFGESIDNTDNYRYIEKYILEQYERFLAEESRIDRNPKFLDTRVHVLVYMITPTGHALKELDISFMKALAQRVNVIPVIAKADTLSEKELQNFKRRVMEDITHHHIPVYSFPDHSDEEEEVITENKTLRSILPFAAIGSDSVYEVDGHQVHGRKYPWGVVQVENPEHCDFLQLQEALFNTHLHILREVTHDLHYENFRRDNLSQTGVLNSKQIEEELQARERAMTEAKVKQQQQLKEQQMQQQALLAAQAKAQAEAQAKARTEAQAAQVDSASQSPRQSHETSGQEQGNASEELEGKKKEKKVKKTTTDGEDKPKKKKEKHPEAVDGDSAIV